ncbi:MAG: 3-hydroxyacyl-ACP dehydratase [Desulfobacterales bacterium]|nr:3-hydroxyacyl-ACP dehydratase [Desulfobacterales bacterium]
MRCIGVDIGSRTIQLVALEERDVVLSRQTDTGFDPVNQTRDLMKDVSYDRIMATGYGRNLFDIPSVTEIKAYGVGSRALAPEVRTVLDIGGQDSKAISLGAGGKVRKFVMNDRCAAGTGKFLEVMARTLGFMIEEFGQEALKAKKDIRITSMCTVFAESEVTTMVSRGENRLDIAMGLHHAIVRRAAGMLKKVSIKEPLIFAGGVANNPCMRHLLEETLERKVLVPQNPQMVGALGAALLAADNP